MTTQTTLRNLLEFIESKLVSEVESGCGVLWTERLVKMQSVLYMTFGSSKVQRESGQPHGLGKVIRLVAGRPETQWATGELEKGRPRAVPAPKVLLLAAKVAAEGALVSFYNIQFHAICIYT